MRRILRHPYTPVLTSVLGSALALLAAVAVADRGPFTDPGNVHPAPVIVVTIPEVTP